VVVVLVVVEVVDVLVVLVEALVVLVDVVGGTVVVVVVGGVTEVDADDVVAVSGGTEAVSPLRRSASEVSAGAPDCTAALHALANRSAASPNARRSNMPPDGSAATAQSDITNVTAELASGR
jgi:hypothetical protein